MTNWSLTVQVLLELETEGVIKYHPVSHQELCFMQMGSCWAINDTIVSGILIQKKTDQVKDDNNKENIGIYKR